MDMILAVAMALKMPTITSSRHPPRLIGDVPPSKKNEDILQHRVVCVKRKRVPEDYNERDIHHGKATKALFQTFGAAEQFVPKNLDGGSRSTKYTEIQSEYVGNLDNIKLLKARIMA